MPKVFIRASDKRKSFGGIWRNGRYFTLGWHEVEMTEEELLRIERDRNLEISEKKPRGKVISDEMTARARPLKAIDKTPLELVTGTTEDNGVPEDGEEDEKPKRRKAKATSSEGDDTDTEKEDDEENPNKTGNPLIDDLLDKQP